MRDPYRILVWGPGGLGKVAIWETTQTPALELVGVRTYSEDKAGVDAGELIGIEPLGVTLTADPGEALAIDCDCVVYTARDLGGFNTLDEIVSILEAGRNVVTPLPFHNVELFEPGVAEKLQQACERGGSVFHASGIDPDAISERVLIGLTGLCADIDHLELREQWELDTVVPELIGIVGIGRDVEEAKQAGFADAISTVFLNSIGRSVEQALGITYERVEETHDYIPAPRDIESTNVTIKAGTVGRVTHSFKGWVEGKGPGPFFTMEYNWFIGHEMLPEGIQPDQYWLISIEGRPSLKVAIDLKSSLDAAADRFYSIGNMQTDPGYHGIVAPCLQAIPLMLDHKPGVMPSVAPAMRWVQDLRALAPRTG